MNSLPKIRKTRILFISYFLSLTSIFTFFFFGEIRNLTTFCLLPLVNNGFSLSSFFLSLLSFLWIGAQFPQEKFLSYGRILTLHYYFLLMCILFSLIFLSFQNHGCHNLLYLPFLVLGNHVIFSSSMHLSYAYVLFISCSIILNQFWSTLAV